MDTAAGGMARVQCDTLVPLSVAVKIVELIEQAKREAA